jgi:dTDP-4-amino-4,6-dideoxygalactose transaminase
MNVPYCDLGILHAALRPEIEGAIRRVLTNSSFILGPEVAQFERQFADYIGVKHAIGTSNGTTALSVALKALGVQPGDEVIIPAMTFFATGEAAAVLGATPVFVDVDPTTLNLDPRRLRQCITARTRVILPVHLYGHPAAMDDIRQVALEYDVKILGDCAHAHGATYRGIKVGALEDIAAFSFYPSKNLGSVGESGIITTNNDELALLCRRYRDHGSIRKFEHDAVGLNARMDGLNAAVLSTKLPYLDEWNGKRREIAEYYSEQFADLPFSLPQEAHDTVHVYHIYQIQIENREQALAFLTRKGIGVTIHYPVPMHLHKGFSYLKYTLGDFPVSETHSQRTLSLPCYPGMTENQRRYVAMCVREWVTEGGK